MVDDGEMLGAEDARHVLVGVRVQAQGIDGDAIARQLLHRALGVVAQVLGVAHVIVGRFAVGDDEQHLLAPGLQLERRAGVAQGRAHAGGVGALHARQPRLHEGVVRLVKVLETVVVHIVPAVGAEPVQREGVANAVQRVRKQHRGGTRQVHDAVVLPAHLVVARLGQVQQHHHRQVALAALVAHHDAGVGLLAHADVDHGAHGRIDVQLVTVFDPADALHALRDHGADQELQARHHRLVLVLDLLDQRQIAQRRLALQHRHPARALQLNLIVPLVVMHRVGHGRSAFQRIDAHAFLVEVELARQHPDFLRVVAGKLVVGLVDHLHQADLLAHLLRGPGGLQRRRLVVGLGRPDGAVVVAVERAQAVGARIEFGQVQRAQAVRQRHADVPAQLVAGQVGLGPEQRHAFLHPGVRVARLFVQQSPRQAVQQIAQALWLGHVGLRVEGQPGGPHVGKLAAGQCFHPRVFHHLDDRLLRVVQRLQRQRRLREHQVGRAVVDHGAVDLRTCHHVAVWRGIALGAKVVVSIGHVDTKTLDVGLEPLAAFVVAGGRAQKEVAAPQGAQVHVEPALHIHEQGALALLLQHRQRVAALQREVFDLALEVGLVGLRAPHHPAPQPAQRELGQQAVQVLQHRAQAAWRLCQDDGQHVQIVAKQLLVAQAAGRQRRRAHDQGEHRTGGLGRHAQQEVDHLRQHVLADGARHLGHGLDEAHHQFFAAPQLVQGHRALEVVVQPARRKHPRRFAPGRAQHRLCFVRQVRQKLSVVFEVDGHGAAGRRAGAGSKVGGHGRVERVAHVGVVGDGAHQRHPAGRQRGHALRDQRARIDQHPGGKAFVQAVALEVARALTDVHQLLGHIQVHARLVRHDLGLGVVFGVAEVQRAEALLGGLLQVLHQRLVARVVGDDDLEVGVRVQQFALLLQR
mmetsp:Transcript_38692/g.90447  ORF Transcript_38692/g.90447 Transcript_38692/m.90447 type:complete len:917 (+) Transcript_38692:6677-9427(+)